MVARMQRWNYLLGTKMTLLEVALAEWIAASEIPVTLLDLNTENKNRGSLKHFFNGSVTKVNVLHGFTPFSLSNLNLNG
jgi:hypothetical protein